jgi:hypothetical protein
MKQTLVIAAAALVSACTTVDYTSQHFSAQSADHRRIAVLPFEMVLTGEAPENLSEAQILEIEESESFAFQTALYHAMLNRASVQRKRPILVGIQPVEETNRMLASFGLDLRDSWAFPADELAAMLGVDAVIRTTVYKTRYLSDLESFGIDMTAAVFNAATEGRLGWLLPYGITTTYDIYADSTLIDADGGDVLWKVVVERTTDWQRPANDVVVGITRTLARKCPYRA